MPSVDYDPRDDADTDLFALLGVQWGAESDEVRRAWRGASRAAHPDAGGSHDAFIALQHACDVLSDPSRRTRYIRAYEARHGPQRWRESTRAGARSQASASASAPPPRSVPPPRPPPQNPPPRAEAGPSDSYHWIPGFDPRQRQPAATVAREPFRVLVVTAVALGIIGLLTAGVIAWSSRTRTVSFADTIKASEADCASDEPIGPGDAADGLALTCTMLDSAPGNRDRPYVQVRLEGCDDWHRLDHDDGADAVTVATRLAPCREVPDSLQWQVCQTHGGLLPDDCSDGSSRLPSA